MATRSVIKKAHIKHSRSKMPFKGADDVRRKPTTWRQKQSVFVQAGLRALKAPMAPWLKVLNPLNLR